MQIKLKMADFLLSLGFCEGIGMIHVSTAFRK